MKETMDFKTLIDNLGKKNKAVIRIKKVTLNNFKNVGHGEITLNCGGDFTESDILGIYGQNGSGKTAFIEALSILKSLMGGWPVPSIYADCVAIGKECADLEFVFDIQYPDEVIREATYSFSMGIKPLTKEEIIAKYADVLHKLNKIPDKANKVEIYNEKFFLTWETESKSQRIIDTSSENAPFTPVTKRKKLVGTEKQVLMSLELNKRFAREQSYSFIFMEDTLKILAYNDQNFIPFRVLTELRYYAGHYLYVIDTKSSGLIRLNFALPVCTKEDIKIFDAEGKITVPIKEFDKIRIEIENISSVLEQLVPGLVIRLKKCEHTVSKTTGMPMVEAELEVHRDDIVLPLRDESDGVRKIISVLGLIIEAFNQPSATVAIDEFDAGIFEYLLGEILQVIEESGCGQFIFTSHNLRPLEVISKKFLCFTTTNTENRYTRLKNISATNNLRDTYFRKIVLCGQEEEIYNQTKRFKMIAALKKAGDE